MIYFVQPVDGGPLKIGTTENLPGRLKQLETHYGCPLALLATLPGGRDEEAEIHSRFAHLRLGRTEQFQPAADLLVFIGRPLLVGANPEAVEAIDPVVPKNTRDALIAIKCWSDFKAWVERMADADDRTVPAVIDRALRAYAKEIGFSEEPPKR